MYNERIMDEVIEKYWDRDFLNSLQEHAMKINEHNLIKSIKSAMKEYAFNMQGVQK